MVPGEYTEREPMNTIQNPIIERAERCVASLLDALASLPLAECGRAYNEGTVAKNRIIAECGSIRSALAELKSAGVANGFYLRPGENWKHPNGQTRFDRLVDLLGRYGYRDLRLDEYFRVVGRRDAKGYVVQVQFDSVGIAARDVGAIEHDVALIALASECEDAVRQRTAV
jgi:hypothetical protein